MSKGTPRRSIRIEGELWDKAREKAADRSENLSDIIRQALIHYTKALGGQMNISDESVEAALKAATLDFAGRTYEDEDGIRGILEAAAPHLIAAWINDTSRLPRDLPGYGPDGSVGAGE